MRFFVCVCVCVCVHPSMPTRLPALAPLTLSLSAVPVARSRDRMWALTRGCFTSSCSGGGQESMTVVCLCACAKARALRGGTCAPTRTRRAGVRARRTLKSCGRPSPLAQASSFFSSGTTTATSTDSKLFPYTHTCCARARARERGGGRVCVGVSGVYRRHAPPPKASVRGPPALRGASPCTSSPASPRPRTRPATA